MLFQKDYRWLCKDKLCKPQLQGFASLGNGGGSAGGSAGGQPSIQTRLQQALQYERKHGLSNVRGTLRTFAESLVSQVSSVVAKSHARLATFSGKAI